MRNNRIQREILKHLHEKESFVKGGELSDHLQLERAETKAHLDFLERKGFLTLNGAVCGNSYFTKISENGKLLVNNKDMFDREFPEFKEDFDNDTE